MHFFYRSTALCIGHLREMGVTAVLNAAQGSMTDWNYVNTKAIYYTGVGIQFLGVPAIDLKWYPNCNHFQEASDFIEEVVKSKGMLLRWFQCRPIFIKVNKNTVGKLTL